MKEPEWTNKLMVQKFSGIPVKAREGNISKGITFLPKIFHLDKLFRLNSPWNYRKFRSNGKRSGNNQKKGKTSAVELPWTHNTPVIYDAHPWYHVP